MSPFFMADEGVWAIARLVSHKEEKPKVIQTLLFVARLNTLLLTYFGTRLPVVIGGSYTFVAATISIILSKRFNDPNPIEGFKQTMQAIQGALIVGSTLQIVLGFSGLWRNVTRFLSPLTPLSAVPLLALAGFGLYEFGFPGVYVIFAILEVGERKPANDTFFTDIES
ncbi:hypothetical protein RHMOL_Rhmol01G0383400 [Rhododendron molle]|uniref:Uncharacterized protein n=3 Tax=Rhododendron molle TaxID=49168 RepID=A0ACC0QBH7_RHOML|nr:hypothetical protein RHMOL_Rhmol01G0383400 [Rhododendron molle]KAI8574821.1 hypothetical protein RHMOL_Rhmol01G0383400 [Rhododendron molle]KAI8574822.1 hypothetical protein RHMOL_Rhmol01G0383400 [Rhododendron molle]